LTVGFMIAAGIATPLLPRIGTKPVIIAGALIAASGIYYLSYTPVDGAFLSDLLPGIGVVAIGIGAVFTGVTTAATEGVPPDKAGIASGLLNASIQFGGALGLAVLSAVATDRTNSVLQTGGNPPLALTHSSSAPASSSSPHTSPSRRPTPARANTQHDSSPSPRSQKKLERGTYPRHHGSALVDRQRRPRTASGSVCH